MSNEDFVFTTPLACSTAVRSPVKELFVMTHLLKELNLVREDPDVLDRVNEPVLALGIGQFGCSPIHDQGTFGEPWRPLENGDDPVTRRSVHSLLEPPGRSGTKLIRM